MSFFSSLDSEEAGNESVNDLRDSRSLRERASGDLYAHRESEEENLEMRALDAEEAGPPTGNPKLNLRGSSSRAESNGTLDPLDWVEVSAMVGSAAAVIILSLAAMAITLFDIEL